MGIYMVSEGEYSDFSIEAIMTGPDGANLHDLLLEFKQVTFYPGDHADYLHRKTWFEERGYYPKSSVVGPFTDWLVKEQGFVYVTYEHLNLP